MATILGYWSIRGVGHPIRYLLEYTGTEYEEKGYELGPAPDYSLAEWTDVKDTLGLEFPNLPYYIDGDFRFSESNAILRHIARKANLAGTTEEEMIRVDMAAGILHEIDWSIIRLCYSVDFEEKKGPFIENGSESMQKASKLVGSENFITRNKVTFVDFLLLEILDRYEALIPDCLSAFPNLKAFQQRVKDLPAIKKYQNSPTFQKIKDKFLWRRQFVWGYCKTQEC